MTKNVTVKLNTITLSKRVLGLGLATFLFGMSYVAATTPTVPPPDNKTTQVCWAQSPGQMQCQSGAQMYYDSRRDREDTTLYGLWKGALAVVSFLGALGIFAGTFIVWYDEK